MVGQRGVFPAAQFEPSKERFLKRSIVLKRGFLNRRVFWMPESVPFAVSAKYKKFGLRRILTKGYNAI
jgi:hypothetical protein